MPPSPSIHRDKLYKEIWEVPATKLAARYGISGSMLARICRELNVPRPGLGHWAKVAHKHKVKMPKLPALKKGQKESWQISQTNVKAQNNVQQIKEAVDDFPTDEKVDHILSAELKEHWAVRDTRRALKGQKPNDKGSVHARWEWKHLNITVSPDLIERSLLFVNRFLHLCEHFGIKVYCPIESNPKQDWDPYSRHQQKSGVVSLRLGDHELAFDLRESYTRTEKPEETRQWYDKFDFNPSGKLEFKIDSRWRIDGQTFWKDGKIKRIEESILMAAQQAKNYFLTQQKKDIERKLQEERRIKLEEYHAFLDKFKQRLLKQRSLEEHTFSKVITQASNWKKAEQLRQYISACEERFATLNRQGAPTKNEDLLKLAWMKTRVEMLDPLLLMSRPWDDIPQSVVEGREPDNNAE